MKMHRSCAVALSLLLPAALPLPAQQVGGRPGATRDHDSRIDSIFAAHDRADAPGCAVGVAVAGDIAYAKGYGRASLEHAAPITPQTAFDIGSVAKQFTALAVLLLEQEGRLSLDDDVRRYLPELPDYGTPITLRDLLQHTSGLRDYGTLELLAGRTVRSMPEFLELMGRQPALNFPPGERHEYSHSDYSLLAPPSSERRMSRSDRSSSAPCCGRSACTPAGCTMAAPHRFPAGPSRTPPAETVTASCFRATRSSAVRSCTPPWRTCCGGNGISTRRKSAAAR